jgi:hypothetical protein
MNRHKEIPWFDHEDLRSHTKALDGYIFTIILDLPNLLDSYNETQVGYIY